MTGANDEPIGRVWSRGRRRSAHHSRRTRWFVAGTIVLSLLVIFEHGAKATPDFPGVVESTWGITSAELAKAVGDSMGCLLCHSDETQTAGKKVTTRVGNWLFGKGLTAYDDATLKSLLQQSEKDGQDSDGDGVSDYQELKDGTNPNVENAAPPPPVQTDGGEASDAAVLPVTEPSPTETSPPLLQTGCSLGHDSRHDSNIGWMTASLVALLLFGRRERRAPAGSSADLASVNEAIWCRIVHRGRVALQRGAIAERPPYHFDAGAIAQLRHAVRIARASLQEISMNNRIFVPATTLTLFSMSALCLAGSAAPVVQESAVKFEAAGPAGLKINGESGGVKASEADGKVKLVAPTTQFHTGIGLRDKHLREAIEADKHPEAALVVDKSAIKFPESGSASGQASGSLTFHGVTHAAPFTYTITKKGAGYQVHGEFTVNLNDYQVKKPCYLGVCVGDVVKVSADLSVAGP